MMDKRIKEILTFWFKEVTPKQKFSKDDTFDALVKKRFEKIYWSIVKGKAEVWRKTPEGRLAEIIVLDQFARNMFRGSKQSFAEDLHAQTLAKKAIDTGADIKILKHKRAFFYMPLMHSESKAVHKVALKVFTELGNEFYLKYENIHKNIIDRFGRFPHRNTILGRKSTKGELEFLKEKGGF